MDDELTSILPSAVALGAAALVALLLTFSRGWAEGSRAQTRGAVRLALVAVLLEAAHFAEELSTGFHERFPALFDRSPMPLPVFVLFNLAWLAIWILSVWGLAARNRGALFPLWFLALASIANGLAHPAFSALEGRYFPGLVTAPAVGIVGVLLLRRLLSLTG